MSEPSTPTPPRRRRRVLAAVLTIAALAAAVPASGAFAGGDSGAAGATPSSGQQRTAPVQNPDANHRGNCPGHHGDRSPSSRSGNTGGSAV